MSSETFSPWDSAEILGDNETMIEYLEAALEENDPESFVKAVGNVARAMGMTTVASTGSEQSELPAESLYKALPRRARSRHSPRAVRALAWLEVAPPTQSHLGSRATARTALQGLAAPVQQQRLASG